MKEVYVIMSPEGEIGLDICTDKGTVYSDKVKAEEALKDTNEWSKRKGYGIHELITLEVIE